MNNRFKLNESKIRIIAIVGMMCAAYVTLLIAFHFAGE